MNEFLEIFDQVCEDLDNLADQVCEDLDDLPSLQDFMESHDDTSS